MKIKLIKQLSNIFTRKGFILLHTLIFFSFFISLFTTKLNYFIINTTNKELLSLAQQRIDQEVAAVDFYLTQSLVHKQSMVIDKTWITYYLKPDQVIIEFEGISKYQMILTVDENQQILTISYKFD